MAKDIVKINGKSINVGKVLIPSKGKTVKDFIKEIMPNAEIISINSYRNKTKPFSNKESFKKWLISNQDGYPKFNYELYIYFANKFGVEL